MKDIYIYATASTPAVTFENSGRLIIEGRSIPKNALAFYDPLISWVMEVEVDTVTMAINLEFINSTSTKKLLELLKILDASSKIRHCYIHWHYEDEDIFEKGQFYEDLMKRASFRYFEVLES